MELYTPLFAVARIAGWSAHRMEELSSGGKLIRPRYECVEEHRSYTPWKTAEVLFLPRRRSRRGNFFGEKRKIKVDIRVGSGYNNQAVFF